MPRDPAHEEGNQEGFPQDGDPVVAATPEPPPQEQPAGSRERSEREPPDPLAELRRQIEKLERDNRELQSRARSASEPKEKKQEKIDWEKELFANPNVAVDKLMEITSRQVEEKLRAEYQRDRGQTEFWNEFYRRNPDLREDHDLVNVTLDKHLSELVDMSVEDAYKKLEQLTRDRIMRYVREERPKKPKARAEGTGPTASRGSSPPEPEPKFKSLTDILKERAQRRRGQAA